jgi:hypothetical protein
MVPSVHQADLHCKPCAYDNSAAAEAQVAEDEAQAGKEETQELGMESKRLSADTLNI